MRALELSGATVPEELSNLWATYKAGQEAEGKKVHTGGGFSGKGFKFDEQEAAAVKENKKLQKAALGLQDSDDDDDLENDIDQQIESLFASKRNVKEVDPSAIATTAPVVTVTAPAASASQPATGIQADKLELARRLASKINIAKNLGGDAKPTTQQTAEALLKGGPPQPQGLITVRSVLESYVYMYMCYLYNFPLYIFDCRLKQLLNKWRPN